MPMSDAHSAKSPSTAAPSWQHHRLSRICECGGNRRRFARLAQDDGFPPLISKMERHYIGENGEPAYIAECLDDEDTSLPKYEPDADLDESCERPTFYSLISMNEVAS